MSGDRLILCQSLSLMSFLLLEISILGGVCSVAAACDGIRGGHEKGGQGILRYIKETLFNQEPKLRGGNEENASKVQEREIYPLSSLHKDSSRVSSAFLFCEHIRSCVTERVINANA